MATLTIQIVTGGGTTSASKTFSGPDSQRILTAYQHNVNSAGTQQTLNDYLMKMVVGFLTATTVQSETTKPAPPSFT